MVCLEKEGEAMRDDQVSKVNDDHMKQGDLSEMKILKDDKAQRQ